jgi:hypothetical protein
MGYKPILNYIKFEVSTLKMGSLCSSEASVPSTSLYGVITEATAILTKDTSELSQYLYAHSPELSNLAIKYNNI